MGRGEEGRGEGEMKAREVLHFLSTYCMSCLSYLILSYLGFIVFSKTREYKQGNSCPLIENHEGLASTLLLSPLYAPSNPLPFLFTLYPSSHSP